MVVRLDTARPLSQEPWSLQVHLIDDSAQVDGKACHFQTISPYPDILPRPLGPAQESSSACRCGSPPSTPGAIPRPPGPRPKPLRRKSKPDSPALPPSPCPAHPPASHHHHPPPPPSPSCPVPPSSSPPTPRKRPRPAHDVDGPGTHTLPIKKRRLRLSLVTSRLSRPFSSPATHIRVRESISAARGRLLLFLRVMAGRRGRVGGGALRKAAILNRVVRGRRGRLGMGINQGVGMGLETEAREEQMTPKPPPPAMVPSPSPSSPPQRMEVSPAEEESEISFPGSAVRYADLSDEDEDGTGDDVYADFGVLFGPGAGAGESKSADYDGYLDELDGIRWGD
ncbi:hypothetical protein F4810DRAFT_524385 [Camillea tinctor]|nr:hypothetical protein F4810DRAFT_524385 [Camillea tinctor]